MPSCVHLEGYLGWPPTESPNRLPGQPVHVDIRGSVPALALQYFEKGDAPVKVINVIYRRPFSLLLAASHSGPC